jgi:glycine dehydrogenase subunit 2
MKSLRAGLRSGAPLQPEVKYQGTLQLCWELQQFLAALTGPACCLLVALGGAHGERTGLLMIRAYQRAHRQSKGHDPRAGYGPWDRSGLGCDGRIRVTVPSDAEETLASTHSVLQ